MAKSDSKDAGDLGKQRPPVQSSAPPEKPAATAAESTGGDTGPARRSSSPTELPAQFGRYRVKKRLGGGGMGTVYLVENTELEREEALKVPHFTDGDDPKLRERFLREAKSAAKLDHPNLCPIYDAGVQDGTYYMTMRFLKGKLLADYSGQAQPARKAVEIVIKLAQALEAAHAKGVIHRDLKPSNVMMVGGVGPVVMDFGLAKQVQQPDKKLTQAGSTLGTPSYMPPEQVKGDLEQMGPASDVYSLGVILYELLTGRLPFEGTAGAIFGQILYIEPSWPSAIVLGLSPTLDGICRKAMGKASADRYPSMKAFAAALMQYWRSTPATDGGNLVPASADKPPIYQARQTAPGTLPAGKADFFQTPKVAPGRQGGATVVKAIPVATAPPSQLRRFLPPRLPWVLGGVAVLLVGLVGAYFLATNLLPGDTKNEPDRDKISLKPEVVTQNSPEDITEPSKKVPEPVKGKGLPAKPLIALTPEEERKVNAAMNRGIDYIKSKQVLVGEESGSWKDSKTNATVGYTCLAGLALLECKVPPGDVAVQGAAKYVRKQAKKNIDGNETYQVALAILFLGRLGEKTDYQLVRSLSLRLVSSQNAAGGWQYLSPILTEQEEQRLLAALQGFSRLEGGKGGAGYVGMGPKYEGPDMADNSNTQFALLGLWASRRYSLPVEPVLGLAAKRFRNTQMADGSWAYQNGRVVSLPEFPSMTAAGLLGLAAGLRCGRPCAGAKSGGAMGKDEVLQRGFKSLAQRVGNAGEAPAKPPPVDMYFLLSVERVAVLYHQAKICGKDWYHWGLEILLAHQDSTDGKWHMKKGLASTEIVDTCFALLFLQRADLAKDLSDKIEKQVVGLEQLSAAADQQKNPQEVTSLKVAKKAKSENSSLTALLQALATDPDFEVRQNVAITLGERKADAKQVVPALVERVVDPKEYSEVRVAAARSLQSVGKCDQAIEAIPRLIEVLDDPQQPVRVRERVLWALRVHEEQLAKYDAVFAALKKVLAEPGLRDPRSGAKMLRYDAAYLFGMFKKSASPDEVFPVLLDFLKDNNVRIFSGLVATAGSPKNGVTEKGSEDGRTMALQALERIGPTRLKNEPAIIQQLVEMGDNPNIEKKLRDRIAPLLRAVAPNKDLQKKLAVTNFMDEEFTVILFGGCFSPALKERKTSLRITPELTN